MIFSDLSNTFKTFQDHSDAISALLLQANSTPFDISEEKLDELKSLFWNIEEKNKKIRTLCTSYILRDE